MAGADRLIAMDASIPAYDEALDGLGPVARDIAECKRMHDQSSTDSVAERLFRRAWAMLAGGTAPEAICLEVAADALVATRLARIDTELLAAHAVEPAAAGAILDRAFGEASSGLAPGVAQRLRGSVGHGVPTSDRELPGFVGALIRQPRAGATAPGKPRLALEPAESHGDHCLAVAVLGTIIALQSGAAPAPVFLAGLAHHLHNAALPDTGFAGEMLLGDALVPLMRRLTQRELATLEPALRRYVEAALDLTLDAGTPEGRAFHAADVIDRVLQAHHHARAAAFTVDQAMGDLGLVHEGPLQAFHQRVLSAVGLA